MRISQIQLIAAIYKHLDKVQGVKTMNQRQTNECIKAADIIVAAFAKEHVEAPDIADPAEDPNLQVGKWLASDEVGMSSRYLCSVLCKAAGIAGVYPGDMKFGIPIPQGPSDFGRCVKMLLAIPTLKAHLKVENFTDPVWRALVGNWSDWEIMYESAKKTRDDCGKMYERMRSIIDAAEAFKEKP